ncbi:MAG: hypothetical protein JWL99_5948 [Streptomyces oryziradicis]|nr:hypothetical protein [Actinacidiphila oryziradicis]
MLVRPVHYQQFVGGRRVGEAAHGVAGQSEFAGDRPQPHALADQGMDGRVLFADPVGEPAGLAWPGRRSRHGLRRLGEREGAGLVRVLRFAQQGPVADDRFLHGFNQVVPDVPAVRAMHRLRRSDASGFGEGRRPIPADDLDARMLGEPSGHRCRRPVGQHIDRATGFDVH